MGRRVLQAVTVLVLLGVGLCGCSSGTSGRRSFPTSATVPPATSGATSGSTPTSSSVASSSATSASACAGACLTDPSTVAAVLAAARVDVEKVNTYRFSTLSTDEAAGLAVATGRFRAAYLQVFRTLAARAPGLRAIQAATVTTTGLQSLSATGGRANVLVAGQLDVTNTASPKGRVDPFVLTASLVRVAGNWLISMVSNGGSDHASTALGNADLARAVQAGEDEAQNALSFARATFDSDFRRALSGSTGALHADIADRRSETRKALIDGGFDLRATIVAGGVVSVAPRSVRLLVRLDGFRSNDPSATQQTLIVTVVRAGTAWLAGSISQVGAG